MEMELSFYLMGLSTLEIGMMARQMEMESKYFQMVLYMMGIGLMESSIKESVLILIIKFTKDVERWKALRQRCKNLGRRQKNMTEIGKWENQ